MGISDITGTDVIDVIADCIEPITSITKDKNVVELFKPAEKPEDMDAREFASERLAKSVPQLLHSHKKDIVAVLAAVHLQSVKQYSKSLTLISLMNDLTELMNDPQFKDFFTSAVAVGNESQSTQTTTEEN